MTRIRDCLDTYFSYFGLGTYMDGFLVDNSIYDYDHHEGMNDEI